MKKLNLLLLAGAAVLLSACIPSVNPFYTEKDAVFDPRLLGEWQEKDTKDQPESWEFEKGDDKAYKLTTMDKEGKRGEFAAHLFKLKREHFLDLVPTKCDYATNQADLVAFAMFPGHLLMRVSQLDSKLKLAAFNSDWLEKYLKEHPKALAHHLEDKHILLTADTRALQRFVLKHLGEGELFPEPGEMVRRPGAPAEAKQK